MIQLINYVKFYIITMICIVIVLTIWDILIRYIIEKVENTGKEIKSKLVKRLRVLIYYCKFERRLLLILKLCRSNLVSIHFDDRDYTLYNIIKSKDIAITILRFIIFSPISILGIGITIINIFSDNIKELFLIGNLKNIVMSIINTVSAHINVDNIFSNYTKLTLIIITILISIYFNGEKFRYKSAINQVNKDIMAKAAETQKDLNLYIQKIIMYGSKNIKKVLDSLEDELISNRILAHILKDINKEYLLIDVYEEYFYEFDEYEDIKEIELVFDILNSNIFYDLIKFRRLDKRVNSLFSISYNGKDKLNEIMMTNTGMNNIIRFYKNNLTFKTMNKEYSKCNKNEYIELLDKEQKNIEAAIIRRIIEGIDTLIELEIYTQAINKMYNYNERFDKVLSNITKL